MRTLVKIVRQHGEAFLAALRSVKMAARGPKSSTALHDANLHTRQMYDLPRKFNVAFDSGGWFSAVAEVAERFGSGEIRLTVWQNLLIPNMATARLEAAQEALKQSLRSQRDVC